MNNSYFKTIPFLFFFICTLPTIIFTAPPITISSIDTQNLLYPKITLTITTPPHDAFYADYFSFSTDHPAVTVSAWHPSLEPVSKYDVTFKATKKVFKKPFTITVATESRDQNIANFNLHVGYYQQSKKQPGYAIFPIILHRNVHESSAEQERKEESRESIPSEKISPKANNYSLSISLSTLLQTTESWWIRLILSLLLGLLLSLTPCIYPMIPITMGILQAQGSRSMRRNFILSFAYTMGIAFTFALLGIMAAFTGKLFGSIMNNPFVILFMVTLLAYLAGSMLGLYELAIPRFLQPSHQTVEGGSLLTAFMFGAASGTVASPCLSPGLLLLLTLVTNIGSLFMGFILLFAFGFGLGIPLLLIGTFSGSLSMLPRAGAWMVDIKQFFGFIMLATCFYFLNILVPSFILNWAMALFIMIVGIFYLKTAPSTRGTTARIKNGFGILLVAASVYAFFHAYKVTDMHFNQKEQCTIWISDFQKGLQIAQNNHKLLLLDIGAPYCSICKAIDKKLFAQQNVLTVLENFVTVKIDDLEKDEVTKAIQKQFHILGAPTIIVWDPEKSTEVYRWGAELYDFSVDEFIKALEQFTSKHALS